jgi:PKD repeat protein
MNWKNLLGSLFLCVAGSVFAQKTNPPPPCYFDELMQQRRAADPAIDQRLDQMRDQVREYLDNNKQGGPVLKNGGNANLVIPVVVYIVHNNGTENITDNQVMSQINVLNTYFDPHGIQFCLATTNGAAPLPGTTTPGIIRIQNAALMDLDVNTEHAALTATSPLPASRYLRIWVVRNINNGTASGLALMPETAPPALDGIVMDFNAFGNILTCGCTTLSPNTQNGRILAHEVGHYLGLYHTFEGGCAGMNPSTCGDEGDEVCDTPPVNSPNSGCTAINSCNETPVDLPDHINNYMDYTSENCLTQFTVGQRNRMHGMIALYRSLLISSANHAHTGISCNGGLLAGFTSTSFAPCVGTNVTFTASAVNGATYTWDFGDGATGTGQVVSHTYTSALDPGSVVLTVTLGGNSVSAIQSIFVEPCTPIQGTEAHWYFYNKKALDFSSGAPVYDNSAFANNTFGTASGTVNELSAVQSDANGNLLFYTDGIRIWNNAHVPITAGLHGHYSAKGGVLIVPDPANNGQYYVLTSDIRGPGGGRGFKYNKVQVTGTTATMVPGFLLPIPITAPAALGLETAPTTNAVITGETVTAIRHAGGYWIIARALANVDDETILVFNLTATGITFHQLTFIQNLVAPVQNTTPYGGHLEASPNGRYIVTTLSASGSPDFLYEFDRCTGTLSNPRQLPYLNTYNFSFSPDSRLLYSINNLGDVFQMNLEPCVIEGRQISSNSPAPITALQRGPDNKIYGIYWQTSTMVTIHRPNNLATAANPNACQFTPTGPATPNGLTFSSSLPNMIDANTLPAFTNTITASVNRCAPQCNTLRFDADLCAPAYAWNFGDPASGAVNNTSTLARPSHTFSANGTYTVSLTANGSTYTTTVTVGISPAITGSLTICPQVGMMGNYSATIPQGYTVQWTASGGTVSGLSNQSSVLVNWTSLPGTVTLTLTDNVTGCVSTRTVTVIQSCAPACSCSYQPSFTVSAGPNSCTRTFSGVTNTAACLQNVTATWNFGDGTTGSGVNTSHVFPSSGTYNVCFTVTALNNGVACTQTVCQQVTISCPPPCSCNFQPTFTSSAGLNNCTRTFSGVTNAAACLQNVTATWNFGDGTTGSGVNTSHLYPGPGTYNVCFTVTALNNGVSCTQTVCQQVTVSCPSPCSCNFQPSFTYAVNPNDCDYHFYGSPGTPACLSNVTGSWDFGDGTTASGMTAGHIYASPGTYTVCFTVSATNNGAFCLPKVVCQQITVTCDPSGCNCNALEPIFDYSENDCIFQFAGSGGPTGCEATTEYHWDFGDGTYQPTGQSVAHVFASPGTYNVCMTAVVFDGDGNELCSKAYCKEISVECNPPECNCGDLKPQYTYSQDDCVFDFVGTSGTPACDPNTLYYWDFGDGTSATGPAVTHLFPGPGAYQVCLIVTLFDENGTELCFNDYCKTIEVECYPPPCDCSDLQPSFDFGIDPETCTVSFTGESGAPACSLQTAYEWDFGDGATSIGPNVGHVYSQPGDYEVCVKVILYDADGNFMCSDLYCKTVSVECAGNCECALDPSFEIVGGGNCDLVFGPQSGSPCVDIISYDWYVNDDYIASGQLFSYEFGVNTNYHVCVVVKGHTPDGDCDAVYCDDYFFTDCYPIWPLPSNSVVAEPGLTLFPNPADNQVTIAFTADSDEAVTVAFRSADGRLLNVTHPLNRGGSQQLTLDVPETVVNGFVFVELTIGERRYTEKLLILRD